MIAIKKDKNSPEKSTRKFSTVPIMYQKIHQKHKQPKEPTNCGVKEIKQRENIQTLISSQCQKRCITKKATNGSGN